MFIQKAHMRDKQKCKYVKAIQSLNSLTLKYYKICHDTLVHNIIICVKLLVWWVKKDAIPKTMPSLFLGLSQSLENAAPRCAYHHVQLGFVFQCCSYKTRFEYGAWIKMFSLAVCQVNSTLPC